MSRTLTSTATSGTLRLRSADSSEVKLPPFKFAHLLSEPYGDWRDELGKQGWTVVKGAVPRERALAYREQMFDWLESFPLGFDRNDEKTWTNEHLPVHMKGGMFHGYGFGHESFAWDLRQEQGIIDAFAHIWGTEELITSFDAGCIMLPKRTDVKDEGRWPHMDQSRHRRGFYCCQGIANLNENGPQDGGLMVLTGSHRLEEEYFDIFGRDQERSWGPFDWYGFTEAEEKWFYDRGCKWEKVCAEPGDLILWDSRALHYNVRPTGERDRVCTYICMAPAELLSEEDRELRRLAFEETRGTTHVPFAAIYARPHEPKLRKGVPDPLDTGKPRQPVPRNDKVLKLAGVMSY